MLVFMQHSHYRLHSVYAALLIRKYVPGGSTLRSVQGTAEHFVDVDFSGTWEIIGVTQPPQIVTVPDKWPSLQKHKIIGLLKMIYTFLFSMKYF